MEIEFQKPAVAIEDQVDPRKNLLVANFGKGRNVYTPLSWVRTAQVVTLASKPVFTTDPGPILAVDEPHPQRRHSPSRPRQPAPPRGAAGPKLKDQLAVEQKVAVTGPSRKEANLIPGLAPVGFEAERQLAIGLPNLGLAEGLSRILQTPGSSSGRPVLGLDDRPRTRPLR